MANTVNNPPVKVVAWGKQWGIVGYTERPDGSLKPKYGYFQTYRDAAEVEALRPFFDQVPELRRG